jgi:hypothetical protein
LVKANSSCSNKRQVPFQMGDNYKKCKKGMRSFKNLLLQIHWPNFN